MTDQAPAADAFTGQFELRDWEKARRIETPSGVIAWELAGALVSCQTAVLTLTVGKPEPVLGLGGARTLLTPVRGDLRVDRTSFPLSAHVVPEKPNRATGSLEIRKRGRTLGFDLELRRNRLSATLFARASNDKPVEVQVFLFYRLGEKGPLRRAPEEAPPPISVPTPAISTAVPPPAPLRADPGAQLAAEWTARLRNTRLSHEENDPQSDYSGSAYFERRVILQLLADRFVLDRSTITRISYAGLDRSSSKRSQLTGTWTILAVAGASRVRLQLTSTDGEQLTYGVSVNGSDSLLVDGSVWEWRPA